MDTRDHSWFPSQQEVYFHFHALKFTISCNNFSFRYTIPEKIAKIRAPIMLIFLFSAIMMVVEIEMRRSNKMKKWMWMMMWRLLESFFRVGQFRREFGLSLTNHHSSSRLGSTYLRRKVKRFSAP